MDDSQKVSAASGTEWRETAAASTEESTQLVWAASLQGERRPRAFTRVRWGCGQPDRLVSALIHLQNRKSDTAPRTQDNADPWDGVPNLH